MFLINHMWDFIITISVILMMIGRFYHISGWNYRIPMGRGDFLKTYIMTFIGILFSVFLTYLLKVSTYDSSDLFYAIIVCVIGAICVSQFFLCGMRRIADLKWCSPLFYPVVFISGLILSKYIPDLMSLMMLVQLLLYFTPGKSE
ncbi:hypothetical protein VEHSUH06_07670 [Veillonella sp. S13053-19]|nr:hypothetical protein VEHSUH06_07670 [Veillonella sp. S13053-19]